jgi:hypothetical protein
MNIFDIYLSMPETQIERSTISLFCLKMTNNNCVRFGMCNAMPWDIALHDNYGYHWSEV